jgi:hypothetical protein
VADTAALAERVRILLEEFGAYLDDIEAEAVAAWQQGLTAEAREEAWRDYKAVQRLRRKFDHVLRTDTLERLQHERQARR